MCLLVRVPLDCRFGSCSLLFDSQLCLAHCSNLVECFHTTLAHTHTHTRTHTQEKMAECKIVDKLVKFVPVRNDVLLMSVLRLLHNLSFDAPLRDAMVKNGLVPKVREACVCVTVQ